MFFDNKYIISVLLSILGITSYYYISEDQVNSFFNEFGMNINICSDIFTYLSRHRIKVAEYDYYILEIILLLIRISRFYVILKHLNMLMII